MPPAVTGPQQPASPLGRAFHILSPQRAAPSIGEVERAFGTTAAPVARSDRHQQFRLPDGGQYLRVAPAPSGAPRSANAGPMTAVVAPITSAAGRCLTADQARDLLIASGWTAPPPLQMELHANGPAATAGPEPFTRHDGRLRLYLLGPGYAAVDCPTRYALLWHMQLPALTRLLPAP